MSDAGPGAVPRPAGLRSAAGQPLELHGSEVQQPKKFDPVVHSYLVLLVYIFCARC